MHTFPVTFAVAVLVIAAAFASINAGHIYLYDGANLDGYYLDWAFHDSQRCYSVPCFNDRTHSLKYRKLPEGGHLVLYEDTGCQGNYYKVAATPHGKLKYTDGGFEFGISSFMVWSTGTYPSKGVTNICEDHPKERTAINATGDAGH